MDYAGDKDPTEKDHQRLKHIVDSIHEEGKLVRFWGTPDDEIMWKFLLDNKVDILNVDDHKKYFNFISRRF